MASWREAHSSVWVVHSRGSDVGGGGGGGAKTWVKEARRED